MLAKLASVLLLNFFRLLTGAKTYWYGCLPKRTQRIYFANHTSHADLVIIWNAIPAKLRTKTRPIAAKDYWNKNAFMRWVSSKIFNVVYVQRHATEQGDPLTPLKDCLTNKQSIIIFPEGTRGFAAEPQKFKSGLYNLALEFPSVELVPIWINNAQRFMPKGKFLPVPISCSVIFGKPLQLQANEQRLEFLERARQAVIELSKL